MNANSKLALIDVECAENDTEQVSRSNDAAKKKEDSSISHAFIIEELCYSDGQTVDVM